MPVSFGIARRPGAGVAAGRLSSRQKSSLPAARLARARSRSPARADRRRDRGPASAGAGVDASVATEAEKRRAWSETGALAVDLESAVVGPHRRRRAGIPFVVAAGDRRSGRRELPPAALIPLAADGTPMARAVLASVLRRPRQMPALIGLARDTADGAGGASPARPARYAGSCWRLAAPSPVRHGGRSTYSAGRCRSSGISGAISPSVRTRAAATAAAFSG